MSWCGVGVDHSSCVVENVDRQNANRTEHIRDQPSMTAPPYRLGTHDGCPEAIGEVEQFEEPVGKLYGLEVVGVAPKPRIPPAVIAGVRSGNPPPAQRWKPPILHSGLRQTSFECVLTELGMTTRSRKPAHVGDSFQPVLPEERNEFVEAAGRVPNGPYGEAHGNKLVEGGGGYQALGKAPDNLPSLPRMNAERQRRSADQPRGIGIRESIGQSSALLRSIIDRSVLRAKATVSRVSPDPPVWSTRWHRRSPRRCWTGRLSG
jgi:hypothetical protein